VDGFPKWSPIVLDVLGKLEDPRLIRQALASELRERISSLDAALVDLLDRKDVTEDWILTIFAPPFEFDGALLVQKVIWKGMQIGVGWRKLVGLLDQTSGFDSSIVLMSIFGRDCGDELVEKVVARKLDKFQKRVLCGKLSEFDVSTGSLEKLYEICRENADELWSFCLLAANKKEKLLFQRALESLVGLDYVMERFSDQFDFYFRVMNFMIPFAEEELLESGFVEGFVKHFCGVVAGVGEQGFPVFEAGEVLGYRKIVVAFGKAFGGLVAECDQILSFLVVDI
jgi:hypothetical protein